MPTAEYTFDWADLAFASKKPVRDLNATFVAAPRELSTKRFSQIVKEYLPKGNLVIGLAKESYVLGLENCPQFKMLAAKDVQSVIDKVNASASKHKVYTLHYSQRDVIYIYEKIAFAEVLLINGSWYHGFHHRPEYYALVNKNIPFTKISPFASEEEAKDFPTKLTFPEIPSSKSFNDTDMMKLAHQAASHSYDYAGLQTGCSVGHKNSKGTYELIATSHNRIVPYETYAMHFGSERERHFSPVNDLNYYDTIHYEVALITNALKVGLDLSGATVFETVLSCPHCTRMFAATDIAEIVYQDDHSDGYAVHMLELAGKKVRRLVP
jgi:deoxycytidylate deaminase